MYRFSEVTYHADSQTVDIGPGLIWDDVYTALEPLGVNVVGGRVTGVGVAGFSLGGGYSWLSNQYGLTVDNIEAFELVLPNGTVTTVDSGTPDLFFSLKGIVTKFTMKTYPQSQVWGGLITFTADQLSKVNDATVNFSTNIVDPKAAIITTYNFLLGEPGVSQLIFYDAPTPPAGIFDDFLAIPFFTKDISTRSFLSLVQSSPANATSNTRAAFNTVSLLQYTPNIMKAIVNESIFWGTQLSLASATFISYDVEPFLPAIFQQGTDLTSAYPPSRAPTLLPLNVYFAWELPVFDALMRNATRLSAQQLTNVALAEGQDIADAALYGNYAIDGTPLERIFGNNLGTMKATKAKYDPDNVMGLAGGWKL
ncbi:hypothetical protein EW026_g5333 [Hermanssonia centrifuga]|uniref:FAD-binding PCMH-type domain-containing protein n=1 Tax=Hermanssonia centrifuga TaxID=98765 RepID=A0A4V3XA36_9APHY|nr:hypothetical protein EW026_g5333 [Hermanssonia centrifuga]